MPLRPVIPIPNTTGNVPVTFAALSYAWTLRLTALSDPLQVPDVEMLTAAMRQELSSASGADRRHQQRAATRAEHPRLHRHLAI
jgi:hypothetical protein